MCHGLVTLHWAHARAVRYRAVASLWPLRARWTVAVCGALSGQRAVGFKLSVWAHVFFSREERMKVVKTSVRGSVMLSRGAASYLVWKTFRGSGNGVKRLCAGGIERWSTSGVVTVSSLTSVWLLRWQQQYRAVGTTAAVWWWWSLKFCVKRRSFLSCSSGIWQQQWLLLGEALTRLSIVLKLRLFFSVDNVVLVVIYLWLLYYECELYFH